MIAIDWTKVVRNLRNAGMSASGIARRCKMTTSTLSHLMSGLQKEPKFSQALLMLDLHHTLCPEKHNKVGIEI